MKKFIFAVLLGFCLLVGLSSCGSYSYYEPYEVSDTGKTTGTVVRPVVVYPVYTYPVYPRYYYYHPRPPYRHHHPRPHRW